MRQNRPEARHHILMLVSDHLRQLLSELLAIITLNIIYIYVYYYY